MKKYILFSFNEYYPGGGWRDCLGLFDTVMEAVEYEQAMESRWDVVQVVDLETWEVVYADNPFYLDPKNNPVFPSNIKPLGKGTP